MEQGQDAQLTVASGNSEKRDSGERDMCLVAAGILKVVVATLF